MIPGTVHTRAASSIAGSSATCPTARPRSCYTSGGTPLCSPPQPHRAGLCHVSSLAGRLQPAGSALGLPWEQPISLSPIQETVNSRHTLLPYVGISGQLPLLGARSCSSGRAGGLAVEHVPRCAGRTIRVVDDDVSTPQTGSSRSCRHRPGRHGQGRERRGHLRALNDADVRSTISHADHVDNALRSVAPTTVIDGAENFSDPTWSRHSAAARQAR